MEPTITIYCKNTRSYHEVPRGISLIELKERLGFQLPYPIIAAHVNYKVENLDFLLGPLEHGLGILRGTATD